MLNLILSGSSWIALFLLIGLLLEVHFYERRYKARLIGVLLRLVLLLVFGLMWTNFFSAVWNDQFLDKHPIKTQIERR